MSRKGISVAVAVWCVVVVLVSLLAWLAIDRAGRAVLADPTGSVPQIGSATTATTRPTTSTTTAPPSPSPSTRTSSSTTRRTTHPGSATTPAGPPASSRTTPPGSTGSSTTRTTTTSSPPAGPDPVERSVQVTGGRVGVRCVGRTISLRYATPSDGWRVELEGRGPEQVKVKFTASREGQESEVEAECQDGTPVFSTSGDDEHRSG